MRLQYVPAAKFQNYYARIQQNKYFIIIFFFGRLIFKSGAVHVLTLYSYILCYGITITIIIFDIRAIILSFFLYIYTTRQIVIIRNKLSARNPSLYYIVEHGRGSSPSPSNKNRPNTDFALARACSALHACIISVLYTRIYYILNHTVGGGVVCRTRPETNRFFQEEKHPKQIDNANNNCPISCRLQLNEYYYIHVHHICVCVCVIQ